MNSRVEYNINFMTSAKGEYYLNCVVPFIFFSLLSEENAHVEIVMEDVASFNKKYQEELLAISQYNSNFLIREPTVSNSNNRGDSLRFYEVPIISSKYTYITDIDVLNLDGCVVLLYGTSIPLYIMSTLYYIVSVV